ncbi:hypothetical protein [Desulfogranum marinum]|uniref:hypothetical protein n=1 Tax=Desulfogranum marinum TaxID=453220 RepID=UPI0029C92057|nr:hypothetical protein [Desulfogranum marinum]
MKKRYLLLAGVLTVSMIGQAQAANLDTGAPGQAISVAAADLNTDETFNFQPSPNVNILCTTSASQYAMMTWHESAVNSSGGEGYGMTSEASGLYTIPIEALADSTAVAGKVTVAETDAAFFSDAAWVSPSDT